MKVLVVGANGDIGQAACDALSERNEIIRAGRSSGDIQVDIADPASVAEMYKKVGPLDALVSTAGDAHFAALVDQTKETFMIGLTQKVMGQVNLVLQGLDHLNDG
ncbi:NAD-dependent epimerase/dehydratase family protein, partial [uncultured Tateyamaria sp.]